MVMAMRPTVRGEAERLSARRGTVVLRVTTQMSMTKADIRKGTAAPRRFKPNTFWRPRDNPLLSISW
jgi:hypothetical protein